MVATVLSLEPQIRLSVNAMTIGTDTEGRLRLIRPPRAYSFPPRVATAGSARSPSMVPTVLGNVTMSCTAGIEALLDHVFVTVSYAKTELKYVPPLSPPTAYSTLSIAATATRVRPLGNDAF